MRRPQMLLDLRDIGAIRRVRPNSMNRQLIARSTDSWMITAMGEGMRTQVIRRLIARGIGGVRPNSMNRQMIAGKSDWHVITKMDKVMMIQAIGRKIARGIG